MLTYLIELRARTISTLLVFLGFFLLYFVFSERLFHLLLKPLVLALPGDATLIATQITSAVLAPLSLAFNTALLSTSPFALFQLWRFVAPGLYRGERRAFKGFILASFVLFFAGLVFCFYAVLPFMFQFFVEALPKDVRMMPDIAPALTFIVRMLLVFGFCFQVPLVCCLLVRLNWLELEMLEKLRPYVLVGAFVLGMLLTPPDVLSQVMLAVPLCCLYELGLWLAKIFSSRPQHKHQKCHKGHEQ